VVIAVPEQVGSPPAVADKVFSGYGYAQDGTLARPGCHPDPDQPSDWPLSAQDGQ